MQFSELSLEISALKALGLLSGADLIEWAVQGLVAGYDSPALRRLAGAYATDPLSEIEPWFGKALTELDIALSQEPLGELFRPYSRLLAQQILQAELPARQGLKRLAKLLYQTPKTDRLLYFFSELEDALDFWPQDKNEAWALYPDLREESPEDCIRSECELFLAFSERADLPEALFLWAYCHACGQWDRPHYRPARQNLRAKIQQALFPTQTVYQAECAHCGAPHPLSMGTVAGRKFWLAQTEKS